MKEFLVRWFNALKRTDRHWLRRGIAVLLLGGGLFGFLPVLGYWMLPLGLALLAVDFPIARRLNRLLQVWWGRQEQRLRGRKTPVRKTAIAAVSKTSERREANRRQSERRKSDRGGSDRRRSDRRKRGDRPPAR